VKVAAKPSPKASDATSSRKADPADLAARIRAGGNIIENLERWAHDAAPDKED
jgi:hypothetical protein